MEAKLRSIIITYGVELADELSEANQSRVERILQQQLMSQMLVVEYGFMQFLRLIPKAAKVKRAKKSKQKQK